MKNCTDLVSITSELLDSHRQKDCRLKPRREILLTNTLVKIDIVAAKTYEKPPIIKMSDRRFVYEMYKLSVPS